MDEIVTPNREAEEQLAQACMQALESIIQEYIGKGLPLSTIAQILSTCQITAMHTHTALLLQMFGQDLIGKINSKLSGSGLISASQ